MFWLLFLCHLIADYPLQTDGLVKAKKHLNGLILHTSLHLATMLVIVLGIFGLDTKLDTKVILVYLLALAILHFGIDAFKNLLNKWRPNWIIQFYFLDQVLHVSSIWLIAYWFGYNEDVVTTTTWPRYLSGYVLVSHPWFVTERILSYKHSNYQNWVTDQMWSRMMSRMVLLTGLLLLLDLNLWGAVAIFGALSLHIFDLDVYRKQALLVDASVTIVVALLIWLAVAL